MWTTQGWDQDRSRAPVRPTTGWAVRMTRVPGERMGPTVTTVPGERMGPDPRQARPTGQGNSGARTTRRSRYRTGRDPGPPIATGGTGWAGKGVPAAGAPDTRATGWLPRGETANRGGRLTPGRLVEFPGRGGSRGAARRRAPHAGRPDEPRAGRLTVGAADARAIQVSSRAWRATPGWRSTRAPAMAPSTRVRSWPARAAGSRAPAEPAKSSEANQSSSASQSAATADPGGPGRRVVSPASQASQRSLDCSRFAAAASSCIIPTDLLRTIGPIVRSPPSARAGRTGFQSKVPSYS